eukprot:m.116963 g.116963  ORF g.116963 m.116963 type:complete len:88 (-) comp13167_c0_seq1:763-1026(-)
MARILRRCKGLASIVCGALLLALAETSLRRAARPSPQRESAPADPFLPVGHHAEGLYALNARDIDGNDVALAKYAGRVTVVVNVASF